MRTGRLACGIGALGALLGGAAANAHEPAPAAAKPGPGFDETVTPVFERTIPNVADRKLVAVVVDYPPGGKSPPHRHAPSAFIYARVLSGAIRSQVGDGPAKVYRTGESFYEDPGSLHRVSENASATEPASLLAVFVVAPDESPLTTAAKP